MEVSNGLFCFQYTKKHFNSSERRSIGPDNGSEVCKLCSHLTEALTDAGGGEFQRDVK